MIFGRRSRSSTAYNIKKRRYPYGTAGLVLRASAKIRFDGQGLIRIFFSLGTNRLGLSQNIKLVFAVLFYLFKIVAALVCAGYFFCVAIQLTTICIHT